MATLDGIMDYLADNSIVEEGTDGDWTYRKWGNGTAECWLRKNYTISIATVATYFHRGAINNIAFPSGLFIANPVCVGVGANSTYWINVSNADKDKITVIYVYDVANGTSLSVGIALYAKGKWK